MEAISINFTSVYNSMLRRSHTSYERGWSAQSSSRQTWFVPGATNKPMPTDTRPELEAEHFTFVHLKAHKTLSTSKKYSPPKFFISSFLLFSIPSNAPDMSTRRRVVVLLFGSVYACAYTYSRHSPDLTRWTLAPKLTATSMVRLIKRSAGEGSIAGVLHTVISCLSLRTNCSFSPSVSITHFSMYK